MDILISFSASVGVVNPFRMVRDLSVDIVNQSIVQWLKNKKFPSVGGGSINNRDTNAKPPSSSIATSTMSAYLRMTSKSNHEGLQKHYGGTVTYSFKVKYENSQRVSLTEVWTYPQGTDLSSSYPSPPWSVGGSTATLNESGAPGSPQESTTGLPLWIYEYTIQNGGYSSYVQTEVYSVDGLGGYDGFAILTVTYSVSFY